MASIKVAVRCRPLLDGEKPATGLEIQGRRILLDTKTYDPDYTLASTATQEEVFALCRPTLQCVKDGLHGTVMVYGQTGTGKTYTMFGVDGAENGIVHRVIAEMLEHVQQKNSEANCTAAAIDTGNGRDSNTHGEETDDGGSHADSHDTDGVIPDKTKDGDRNDTSRSNKMATTCVLALSMMELYNEKLTDMLSEGGDEEVSLIAGYPRFTRKVLLSQMGDATAALKSALALRRTAATSMNDRSSRSHVLVLLDLEELNAFTGQTDVAHLFLVDLAGSESLKKSHASGLVASETGKINRSLLALKSVLLALANTNEATRPSHIPYRDSKLTELLQDSLGGSAKTVMIACISNVGRDVEETKSTLMYALKARSIRNAANTEKEKLLIRLRSMEVENQRLRNRLQQQVGERGGYYVSKEDHEEQQRVSEECARWQSAAAQLTRRLESREVQEHIVQAQRMQLEQQLARAQEESANWRRMYAAALDRTECERVALCAMVQRAVSRTARCADAVAQESHWRLQDWQQGLFAAVDALGKDGHRTSITEHDGNATLSKTSDDADRDEEDEDSRPGDCVVRDDGMVGPNGVPITHEDKEPEASCQQPVDQATYARDEETTCSTPPPPHAAAAAAAAQIDAENNDENNEDLVRSGSHHHHHNHSGSDSSSDPDTSNQENCPVVTRIGRPAAQCPPHRSVRSPVVRASVRERTIWETRSSSRGALHSHSPTRTAALALRGNSLNNISHNSNSTHRASNNALVKDGSNAMKITVGTSPCRQTRMNTSSQQTRVSSSQPRRARQSVTPPPVAPATVARVLHAGNDNHTTSSRSSTGDSTREGKRTPATLPACVHSDTGHDVVAQQVPLLLPAVTDTAVDLTAEWAKAETTQRACVPHRSAHAATPNVTSSDSAPVQTSLRVTNRLPHTAASRVYTPPSASSSAASMAARTHDGVAAVCTAMTAMLSHYDAACEGAVARINASIADLMNGVYDVCLRYRDALIAQQQKRQANVQTTCRTVLDVVGETLARLQRSETADEQAMQRLHDEMTDAMHRRVAAVGSTSSSGSAATAAITTTTTTTTTTSRAALETESTASIMCKANKAVSWMTSDTLGDAETEGTTGTGATLSSTTARALSHETALSNTVHRHIGISWNDDKSHIGTGTRAIEGRGGVASAQPFRQVMRNVCVSLAQSMGPRMPASVASPEIHSQLTELSRRCRQWQQSSVAGADAEAQWANSPRLADESANVVSASLTTTKRNDWSDSDTEPCASDASARGARHTTHERVGSLAVMGRTSNDTHTCLSETASASPCLASSSSDHDVRGFVARGTAGLNASHPGQCTSITTKAAATAASASLHRRDRANASVKKPFPAPTTSSAPSAWTRSRDSRVVVHVSEKQRQSGAEIRSSSNSVLQSRWSRLSTPNTAMAAPAAPNPSLRIAMKRTRSTGFASVRDSQSGSGSSDGQRSVRSTGGSRRLRLGSAEECNSPNTSR